MSDLIILGTGVHAAEMAEIVERINQVEPTWNLLGFIAPDEQTNHAGEEINGYPILGTRQVLTDYPDAWYVPDNGFPDLAEIPTQRLASIIAPSSFVSRTARIGPGCVVYPNCFIGLNVTLGNRVFILSGSIINHDDKLGDGAVVCSGVSLAGFVTVEDGCYLGQACTIKQYLRIGRGSLIGMGSVVVKDVPPNSVMVGNPARRLRERNEPR
jgi:sugar O-acyltransferase (sialic acid O-acetyltransferase NeuD family)